MVIAKGSVRIELAARQEKEKNRAKTEINRDCIILDSELINLENLLKLKLA
jgi:hypothetical protein